MQKAHVQLCLQMFPVLSSIAFAGRWHLSHAQQLALQPLSLRNGGMPLYMNHMEAYS